MTPAMSDQEMRALLDQASHAPTVEMDPNDLAHLATGDPDTDTEQALVDRLAQSTALDRDLVFTASQPAAAPSVRPAIWRPWAIAASVLCVVGAAWMLARTSTPGSQPADDDTLVAAFEKARAQAPEAFEGVAPMLHAERAVPHTSLLRGGVVIHSPVGAYRDNPATATWEEVPGAENYTVRVLDDRGGEVIRTEVNATTFAWPERQSFARGRGFTLIVTTHVAGMRQRGSTVFRTLTEKDRANLLRAEDVIDSVEPPTLRSVMYTQLALRRGLIEEAREHAKAGDAKGPWSQWILEMRKHLGVATSNGTSSNQ